MLTVGDLKSILANIPDHVWVCLKDGPLETAQTEMGAGEPFILLESKRHCLHGAPPDETCGACEAVKSDMGRTSTSVNVLRRVE